MARIAGNYRRATWCLSVNQPSSSTPVTSGSRISSFFWIQSMIRDDGRRTLLFDLDMAIQRLTGEAPDHRQPYNSRVSIIT